MKERLPPFDSTLSQALLRLEEFERAVVERVRCEASAGKDGEGLNRVAAEYDRRLSPMAESELVGFAHRSAASGDIQ